MLRRSLGRFWSLARSWIGDKRVDEVFVGTNRSSTFIGLRYVKVIHVDPGKRAVVDIMLASGERVYAGVRHGEPMDRTCESVLEEMANHRRIARHEGDLDPRVFMRQLMSSMTAPDGTVDLGKAPSRDWLNDVFRGKLLDFIKPGGPEKWDHAAAIEAARRHFAAAGK